MRTFPDVRLSGDADALVNVVQVCSGVVQADEHDQRYELEAIVPNKPWRSCGRAELGELLSCPKARGMVGLVRLPSAVHNYLRPSLAARLRRDGAAYDLIKGCLSDTDFRLGIRGILDFSSTYALRGEVAVSGPGLHVSPIGLPTTTMGDSRLVGLHFDSWHWALDVEPSLLPGRMCFNVGSGSRWFLFADRTICALLGDVPVLRGSFAEQQMARLTQASRRMAALGRFRLFRIKVDPGEGYYAPTEIVLHDASSEPGHIWDVTFTVNGRFYFDTPT